MIHEFCHVVRSYYETDKDGYYALSIAQYEQLSDTSLLSECMNSIFSCSLLNYYERNIAYQIPSNYLRIIIECMDYDMRNYIEKSDAYFFKELDEYAGYTNYAYPIWKLIEVQRNDYMTSNIDLEEEEYLPIYDFLCELYYKKYITEDMTDEQMQAIADELVDKAFYDCPEGYKINTQRFYDNLEQYKETLKA